MDRDEMRRWPLVSALRVEQIGAEDDSGKSVATDDILIQVYTCRLGQRTGSLSGEVYCPFAG
jgi:hypothetical protein